MELAAFYNGMRSRLRTLEYTHMPLMVKLTGILLLAGCLQLSAKSYGQTITVSKTNAPLQEIFIDIYRQTGYFFMCKDNLLENAHKVNIQVREATLQEVLDICFKDQPLEYSISDHVIVVSRKNPVPVDVNGKVSNEKGESLEGAAVFIKGTKHGTQTNGKGMFEIKTEAGGSIELEISFTGYVAKTITVHPGEFVNVLLSLSTSPLDQIQVIAYGTTSKRLSTGDVSSVKSETIAAQPVSNFLAALEGRVPGLVITQQTGVPGGGFFVQINGQNSIASGNNPYYIVDGVPFTSTSIGNESLTNINVGGSPLNNINPGDIERIDILKDADATAIYGSRGANGVILITTKKGKAGKTVLDLRLTNGSGKISHTMKLLNNSQYLSMRHEAFANDGATPGIYDYDLTAWDTTRQTDWQKTLLGGTAVQTNAQVSISGGSEGTQFLVGGNYFRETTVFPGNFADQKISTHFNLNHVSGNNKFRITLSGNFLSDQNNLPETDLTSFALTLPPDAPPLYDSAGKINWGPVFFDNPLRYLLQEYNVSATTLIGNSVLSYQIIPSLQAKVSLGYTQTDMNEIVKYPVSSFLPIFNINTGSSVFSTSSIKTWITEPQLIWHKQFTDNNLEVLIGTTFQQDRRLGTSLQATGYKSDALLGNMAAASAINTDPRQPPYDLLYRYTALFGRIHFDHKGKYIANITGRRDGSSRFGPGNQFANFGATGLAWVFSEEPFLKNRFSGLSFGKLSSSFGITGNDQIKDYQYLSNWIPTTYPYLSASGVYPTNLANQNYAWETNKKWEAAVELGFLKDRLLFSTRYYQNRSSNQLVGYALPSITGFPSVQANLPAIVQNTGWEFEFSAVIIKTQKLSWTASVNLTIPRNKLLSYPNIEGSPYASVYEVGKSLYIKKMFHNTGVDPQSGVYLFQTNSNNNSQDIFNPIYPDDLQGRKEVAQTYYGGFSNSLTLKNWKLDIFIQFSKQTGFNYLYSYFGAPGFSGNQPTEVLKRWQKAGDRTSVQKFTQDYGSDAYTAFSNAQYYGDNSISDASFLRLKNVQLSYQLPTSISQKAMIQSARIFIQGQNLFTITDFLGMDPENQNLGNLPALKMIVAGIQITL